jgi:hypothetical protein
MPESPGLSLGNGYTINLTDGWTFVIPFRTLSTSYKKGGTPTVET